MSTPTSPAPDFHDWDRINTWMQEEVIDVLRSEVDAKVRLEWGLVDGFMTALFPAAGVVKLITGLFDSSEVTFPDYTYPDGRYRKIEDSSGLATAAREVLGGFEEKARALVTGIENIWRERYKDHSQAPAKLNQTSTLWGEVSQQVTQIPTEVGSVQAIPGWQGAGAEAYGRIVPSQSNAANSTQQIITDGSVVLGNAATGLRALYLSFAAQVQHATQLIKDYDGSNADGWQWLYNTAPNARYCCLVLEETARILSDDLPGNETEWADDIKRATRKVTDEQDLDGVFVDQKWPASKADELANLEPGGDSSAMPTGSTPYPGGATPTGPGGTSYTPTPSPSQGGYPSATPGTATDVENLDKKDYDPDDAKL